jgi:hypothetical protein
VFDIGKYRKFYSLVFRSAYSIDSCLIHPFDHIKSQVCTSAWWWLIFKRHSIPSTIKFSATSFKHEMVPIGRYQRGNQKPYIEEQTTQWPKEKVQKDKQRSTKHTYKTKDRVTPTPLKTSLDGNMVSPVMGFPLISHAATLLPLPSLISHDCGVTRGICYVQCKYEI